MSDLLAEVLEALENDQVDSSTNSNERVRDTRFISAAQTGPFVKALIESYPGDWNFHAPAFEKAGANRDGRRVVAWALKQTFPARAVVTAYRIAGSNRLKVYADGIHLEPVMEALAVAEVPVPSEETQEAES